MFRALAKRVGGRWKFVSFRGNGGAEWRGVVDILAVRKSTAAPTVAGLKAGDLFDFVLVQLKGGSGALAARCTRHPPPFALRAHSYTRLTLICFAARCLMIFPRSIWF